jgi:thioesterase domain-containing protein/acyl carrier protein
VVLKEGATATENELREFAFARLAYYKVPGRVLIVDEIPKGPTGKLQRIGLADKLAHQLEADFVAPRTQVEQTLAGLWADALHLEQVGVYDNFFSRGGDSLQAAQLALCVQAAFRVELPPETVFRNPTIDALARLLADRLPAEQPACTTVQKEETSSRSSLVAVQPGGAKRPLFLVPSPSGTALHFADLARHLGPEQPVYSFQPLGLDGKFPPHTRVEDMAAHYIREMRSLQPTGPYLLGGMCSGSYVAFEMAQQLQGRGEQVALLAVLDVWAPPGAGSPGSTRRPVARPRRPPAQLVAHWLRSLRPLYRLRCIGAWILGMLNGQTWRRLWRYYSSSHERRARHVLKLYRRALQRYKAQPYSGRVALFQSGQLAGWTSLSWTELVRGELDRYLIPKSSHYGLLRSEADTRRLAEQLRACLDKLQI